MTATILIADDDAVQRRLLENMVQRMGYHAVTADSGDAALAHLPRNREAGPIDAIVLDLVMPGLDGMGVLAKMREAGLRASGDRADRPWRHRQCGVGDARGRADFVVKPVGVERLQVSLRNALAMPARSRANCSASAIAATAS
jgi:DNA-binding NtrC family response regulator